VHSLNLGILAHVDAGKTSLTERLLFAAGVIDKLGRVDDGSTQTDTLALERQRGITIRAAVVSFAIGDLVVNLIDTPGHPDFIAEVERSLGVLDGAVLVVSAVEGVQPQTRILMRALRRLGVPTLIFVNKIDRAGAGYDAVLAQIAALLTPAVVAMGGVDDLGSQEASWRPFGSGDPQFTGRLTDVLTEHDDALLAAYVADASTLSYGMLWDGLTRYTKRSLVHPVYFGSAITGAGVDALTAGIAELLPAARGDASGPPAGRVFKIERGRAGEKIAYLRMFAGTLSARAPVAYGADKTGKVTAISVFDGGPPTPRATVRAGQIARVCGLADIQVGDAVGDSGPASGQRHFAPPTMEAAVTPVRAADRAALHVALAQLAEQDPLITLRQDDSRHETTVSLYGEVQQQVIQAMLADEFGIGVTFRVTTTICVERVLGTGTAAEFMGTGNPFQATVGLRVQPGPPGSGVRFRLEVELGSMPLAFIRAVEDTARDTLREGLHGWGVIDCTITLTHVGYVPPPPSGWSNLSSSGGDFRNLTPLVLMSALQQAGTQVCEPVSSIRLEIPESSARTVLTALARLGATQQAAVQDGERYVVEADIAAAQVGDLRQQLPALTGGEGILEAEFARYRPAASPPPVRPRTDHNPLDRTAYLLRVQRGLARSSAAQPGWPASGVRLARPGR